MNLIVPHDVINERSVPEWFEKALKDVDPSLIVYWNPIRLRWIIDRCTAAGEHRMSNHAHTSECPRTNVRVVQDENGEFMPLCQSAIDWLREHDRWNQHSNTHDLITDLGNKDAVYQDKLRADRRDNTHHRTRDHKRQLGQMWHLIQQHNLDLNR